MALRQTAPRPHGNSSRRQSLQEDASVNPSKEVDPSMLASITSTDAESEIVPLGNPNSIPHGRKTL
jgi:hypothetical protein